MLPEGAKLSDYSINLNRSLLFLYVTEKILKRHFCKR